MHQTVVDNFGRNRRIKKKEWPPLFIFTQTHFNAFANRVDPDQASLVRAPDEGLLCLLKLKYDISVTTQVTQQVISLFHVQI